MGTLQGSRQTVVSGMMSFVLALFAALAIAVAVVPAVPATAEAATSDEDVESYYESHSLKGFIEWMLARDDLASSQVADLENAYSMLEGYIDSGEIDIYDSDDAASLDNFAHSLEILATIGELRESDEYYNQLYSMTALYTNLTMMVGSAYTANVSIYQVAHVSSYSIFASNENLAWGYTNPTSGWYTAEKSYVDQAVENLSYSVETLTSTQWSTVLTTAASYGTIGHYTNLFYGVSSGYDTLMGVGYTTESYLYSRTASSNAALATRYSSYYAYTASELQAYLAEYEASLSEDLSSAEVALSKTSYVYTGKAKKPAVTVTLDGTTLVKDTDYTVSYSNNTKAGTATVTVTGTGSYTGSAAASFKITKATQTLTVKKAAKTIKYAKVKKSKQTVKAITKVSGAKGTVTYTLKSAKKSGKSYKSKFTVNSKTGKVTVKKGTKKGTYKVKIKVKAAATTNYKAASKTVTVTVKVK